MPDEIKTNEVKVRQTPVFKLKDKPNRGAVSIPLEKTFGFMPESILIRKVHGKNNAFQIAAPIPEKKEG